MGGLGGTAPVVAGARVVLVRSYQLRRRLKTV